MLCINVELIVRDGIKNILILLFDLCVYLYECMWDNLVFLDLDLEFVDYIEISLKL